MKKAAGKLEARREHVKDFINNYEGKTVNAVKDLSESLFLSKATIWSDLKESSRD